MCIHCSMDLSQEIGEHYRDSEPEPGPGPEPEPETEPEPGPPCALVWSPDGDTFAWAADGQLRLLDLRTGVELARAPAPGVRKLWWGTALRSWGDDGIRTWRPGLAGVHIDAGAKWPPVLAWHEDRLACAARGDRPIRVIDARTGALLWDAPLGEVHYSASGDPFGYPDETRPARVFDLAFASDGVLVAGGEGEHVAIFTATGSLSARMPVDGWTRVRAVAVSSEARQVAAFDERGKLRVADLAKPTQPRVVDVIRGPVA